MLFPYDQDKGLEVYKGVIKRVVTAFFILTLITSACGDAGGVYLDCGENTQRKRRWMINQLSDKDERYRELVNQIRICDGIPTLEPLQ